MKWKVVLRKVDSTTLNDGCSIYWESGGRDVDYSEKVSFPGYRTSLRHLYAA